MKLLPQLVITSIFARCMKLSFDNTEIAFQHKNKGALRKAYTLFKMLGSSLFVSIGKGLLNLALFLHFPIKWAVKPTIFAQFCGGETIAECASTTKILDDRNVGTILDYSVEGKEDEEDLDSTCEEIKRTVQTAHNNPHIPFCVFKVTGVARLGLLEKVNEKKQLTESEVREFERVKERVESICKLAASTGTPVFIDAEESWMQDAIDGLAQEMMMRYNTSACIVYTTAQLYRHDRFEFIKSSAAEARERGYFFGIKLVRGAYMEKERDRAEDLGYTSPIQPTKADTDRDFNNALRFCVQNLDVVSICAGTHNEESSMLLAELIEQSKVERNDARVYFAQLFGMSDHISFNLSDAGYNVAKYVPYGPIREVMPYLIRRADENTSVKGQTGRELNLILKELHRRKGVSLG
jgi:proline dehydrogenase